MEQKAEPTLEQVQDILSSAPEQAEQAQQTEAPEPQRKPTLIRVKPTTLDTKQAPPPPAETVEKVEKTKTEQVKPPAAPQVLSRKVIGRLPPKKPQEQYDSDSDYDEFGIKTSSQATRDATFGPKVQTLEKPQGFMAAKVENPIDPAMQGMFSGSPKNQFEPKQQVFRRGGVKPINEAASQQLIQAANAELNQRMAQAQPLPQAQSPLPQVIGPAPSGFSPAYPNSAQYQPQYQPMPQQYQPQQYQPMPQQYPPQQYQPMPQQYPPQQYQPMPQQYPPQQYQPQPQQYQPQQYQPQPQQYQPQPQQYQPQPQPMVQQPQYQLPPQVEEELRWMREQLRDLLHNQRQLVKISGSSEFENFRQEYEADRRQLARALEKLGSRRRY